jgi:hypothetical protein
LLSLEEASLLITSFDFIRNKLDGLTHFKNILIITNNNHKFQCSGYFDSNKMIIYFKMHIFKYEKTDFISENIDASSEKIND